VFELVASGIATEWMDMILEFLFGAIGSPWTSPAHLYIGLCTGITAAGVITGEPIGVGAYVRKEIDNDNVSWNGSSGGALDNKIAFTFITATGDWGELTDFFIANHSTNDGIAIIGYGKLAVAKHVTDGDTASFAIGALDISLIPTT
jgi:hypothetical protein